MILEVVSNLIVTSWNKLCSGKGTLLQNGKCHFFFKSQQVARMLLSRGVQGTVGCRSELEVAGKKCCPKGKQQQILGTAQMRWKMTGWFAVLGLGLRLLKLELDGI